jgi:hypothetical protein
MTGEITSLDVLRHPRLVIQLFGWRKFGRCMLAILTGKRTTFLNEVW